MGVRVWVRIEEWAVKTQTTSKLACKSVRKSLTGMSETQEGLYLTQVNMGESCGVYTMWAPDAIQACGSG